MLAGTSVELVQMLGCNDAGAVKRCKNEAANVQTQSLSLGPSLYIILHCSPYTCMTLHIQSVSICLSSILFPQSFFLSRSLCFSLFLSPLSLSIYFYIDISLSSSPCLVVSVVCHSKCSRNACAPVIDQMLATEKDDEGTEAQGHGIEPHDGRGRKAREDHQTILPDPCFARFLPQGLRRILFPNIRYRNLPKVGDLRLRMPLVLSHDIIAICASSFFLTALSQGSRLESGDGRILKWRSLPLGGFHRVCLGTGVCEGLGGGTW